MSEKKDRIYSAIATVALSVLALPVTLLLSIPKVGKIIRAIQQLDDGTIPCRFCGTQNPAAVMSRCSTCGAVEPGSRLRCSFCKTVYQVVSCSGCGATLRVF
jgi:hypothetical protein